MADGSRCPLTSDGLHCAHWLNEGEPCCCGWDGPVEEVPQ